MADQSPSQEIPGDGVRVETSKVGTDTENSTQDVPETKEAPMRHPLVIINYFT